VTNPREEPGKFIYHRRAEGMLWSLAGAGTELELEEGLLAARDYADENDLPWPPLRSLQGKSPSLFKGDVDIQALVGRTFMFHRQTPYDAFIAKEIYRLRWEGRATWRAIGERVGLLGDTCRHWATKYANENDLPTPPVQLVDATLRRAGHDRPRQAYQERLLGQFPWKMIAARLGYNDQYKSGYNALEGARDFAKKHGLPWPVPHPKNLPVEGPRQELTYKYRASGLTWRAVNLLIGYKNPTTARKVAAEYAEKRGLPWPLVV
jgi:hypothetical protein